MLIGVMGALGAGKSTVARHLVTEHGFTRMRMADTLKDMLRTFGLSEAQVDGDLKEVPTSLLCGLTPRWAMQSLGTEWGRNTMHPDLWVAAMQYRLVNAMIGRKDLRIVLDDIRFPNEMNMIAAMGGALWKVRNPAKEPPEPRWYTPVLVFLRRARRIHPSELHWRAADCDDVLWNTGDLDHLGAEIERALSHLETRHGSQEAA